MPQSQETAEVSKHSNLWPILNRLTDNLEPEIETQEIDRRDHESTFF